MLCRAPAAGRRPSRVRPGRRVTLVNKSAWLVRALKNSSIRYYFVLEPGLAPGQITTGTNYSQCGAISGPTQDKDDAYYVSVDWSGTTIAPAGQSAYHKERQFRVASSGAWDFADDWS